MIKAAEYTFVKPFWGKPSKHLSKLSHILGSLITLFYRFGSFSVPQGIAIISGEDQFVVVRRLLMPVFQGIPLFFRPSAFLMISTATGFSKKKRKNGGRYFCLFKCIFLCGTYILFSVDINFVNQFTLRKQKQKAKKEAPKILRKPIQHGRSTAGYCVFFLKNLSDSRWQRIYSYSCE